MEPRTWWIDVAPWVIQDGNYPDFEVGRIVEFALEFDARKLTRSSNEGKLADHLDEANYEISAEVLALDERSRDSSWILDFGLRAYTNGSPPDNVAVGDRVAGNTLLMIDHWYFETLGKSELIPELIYTWRVDQILREAGPTRRAHLPGWGEGWEPDRDRGTYELVPRTDAWGDDHSSSSEGPPSYLGYTLECSLQDVPPRRSRSSGR